MFTGEEQALIRLDIFAWLEMKLLEKPWLTREELLSGYKWRGNRIPLISTMKGIWNPSTFSETLSILSTPKSKYTDKSLGNGDIHYAYEATNPLGGANAKLRLAMHNATPLVYFEGFEPGKYTAHIEVFVTDDNFSEQYFVVNLNGSKSLKESQLPENENQKRYVERKILQRVHQPKFRAQVIVAYRVQCAVCRLQHIDLLDAAHIIPDSDEAGIASVTNGLSLCKIHHAAYDRNLMGINPDYKVVINKEVLLEVDGPMLKFGIQAMHGESLQLPKKLHEQPDKDLLARRFEEFVNSVP
jgi:putative restriction endonuclease